MHKFGNFIIFLSILISMPYALEGQGLKIVNQTSQMVKLRASTMETEYEQDLSPNASYGYSFFPTNLTLYSPQGTCSKFYNIGMNPSVFTHLIIRNQRNTRGCYVIGFAGRSRQRSSRPVPAIQFDPNQCASNCWNATTGAVNVGRTNGVVTGVYTQPAIITNAGTDLSFPNPSST